MSNTHKNLISHSTSMTISINQHQADRLNIRQLPNDTFCKINDQKIFKGKKTVGAKVNILQKQKQFDRELDKIVIKIIPYFQDDINCQESIFRLMEKQMVGKSLFLMHMSEQLGDLVFIDYIERLMEVKFDNFLQRFSKMIIIMPTTLQICRKSQMLEVFIQIINRLFYFPYGGNYSLQMIDVLAQLTHFLLKSDLDIKKTPKLNHFYRDISSHMLVYYQLVQISQIITQKKSNLMFNGQQMSQIELQLFSLYEAQLPFESLQTKIKRVYQAIQKKLKNRFPSRYEATSLAFFSNLLNPQSPQWQGTSSLILDCCQTNNYTEIFMILKTAKYYYESHQKEKQREFVVEKLNFLFHQIKVMLSKQKYRYIFRLKGLIQIELTKMLNFIDFNKFKHDWTANQVIYSNLELPTKKSIDWKRFVNNLKVSINFSDWKISSIFQMQMLENRVSSGKPLLNCMHQIQLQQPGQVLMQLFKSFPLKNLFDKSFLQNIEQILKVAQAKITNSILIHYLRWILIQLQNHRGRPQQKQIYNYFYGFLCIKIIYIDTNQPKLQQLQNAFLHTSNLLQKIHQSNSQSRKKIYQKFPHQQSAFFKVLKKLNGHYLRISDLFKKYGSLKHSAYFLQLQYFETKCKNKIQVLKQKARSLYCQLVPQLNSIQITDIKSGRINVKQNKKSDENLILMQNLTFRLRNIRAKNKFNDPSTFCELYSQLFQSENLIFSTQSQIIINAYLKLQGLKNLLYDYRQHSIMHRKDNGDKIIRQSCGKFKNYRERIAFLLLAAEFLPQQANRIKAIYYEQLLNNRDIDLLETELNVFQNFQNKTLEQLEYLLQICVERLYQQFALKIIRIIRTRLSRLNIQEYSIARIQIIWSKTYYLSIKIQKQTQLNFNWVVKHQIVEQNKKIKKIINYNINMENNAVQNIVKALKCSIDVNYSISQQLCLILCETVQSLIQAIIKSQKINKKCEIMTQLYIFTMKLVIQKIENQDLQNELVKLKVVSLLKQFPADSAKCLTSYLIQAISNRSQRDAIIVNQLIKIGQQYPQWSTWWISSLCCHTFEIPQEKRQQIDKQIQLIGNYIYQESKIQSRYLEFISIIRGCLNTKKREQFAKKSNKTVNIAVPKRMTDPFDCDMILKSFSIDMTGIGSGKSDPLRARAQYEKNKTAGVKYYILKKNLNSNNYRIQAQSTSFYRQLKLIDEQTTYSIINLSKNCQLLEQIQDVQQMIKIIKKQPKGDYLNNKWAQKNDSQEFCRLFDKLYPNARSNFYKQVFEVDKISVWWDRFNNYARTTAQWSYVGYISGLGDRHFGNILMTTSCKVAHIDFQYNLDFGKELPFPQWVPFRLTKAVKEPFGILQQQGLFLSYFVQIASQLRKNQNNFEQAISSFYSGPKSIDVLSKMKNRALFTNRRGSITQSCQLLISIAGSQNILRDMFVGWKAWL